MKEGVDIGNITFMQILIPEVPKSQVQSLYHCKPVLNSALVKKKKAGWEQDGTRQWYTCLSAHITIPKDLGSSLQPPPAGWGSTAVHKR